MGYETDHKWSGSAAISGTCEAPCSAPRTYHVWFEQVNQCMIEVKAKAKSQAIDKAYRVWRRDYATSRASYIEEVPNRGK